MVGVQGAAPPQIIGEQRFELYRDEAHLRSQLHSLLPQIEKIGAELAIEENYRLATQDAILRAPKRKDVRAQIARSLSQRLAQTRSRIGDPSAVHVQKHFVLMRKAGQCLNFSGLVDRAHLG